MLNFLICLLAYPNVRTEPQSDIGRNRGKKNVSMANLVLFVWVFCLGPGPVPCFASLLFLFGETQIWPGDLRVVGFGGLWCCFCLMFCPFLMKPRRFMLNFLICLLAYPNVRTEPQSDIGHN